MFILELPQRVHYEKVGVKQGENGAIPPYWGGCEGAGAGEAGLDIKS
jgi:hypothetical protein